MSRSPAPLSLSGITKRWAGRAALDDISLNVEAGSFCVLLGPSGCGKTTLLRVIAGLETADSGRVEVGGRDVTALPPAARGLAMVFQSYALFPHLSVAENILFGLRARRVGRAERAARLRRAAAMLGLGALLERRPAQLSGGQQQRVALGRAVVAEAPVCLMDEPLSNLDAQLRAEMRREIHGLQRRLGITMIYVTHDQTEAMAMADQVVLLRAGRIEADAPPATLYARPRTVFTAGFCTPATYAFARMRFPGRDLVFAIVLLQLMVMPDMLLVANYRAMARLGLVDSIMGIALPYLGSAFGIFLLRQTFSQIPQELEDAARLEGASLLRRLWCVYVPLARLTYVAYGLVSVAYHWNNFLWPLVVTNSVRTRPLTVGFSVFAGTDQGIDWSVVSAATLMTSAPLLLAFLQFQRQSVASFMRAGIR